MNRLSRVRAFRPGREVPRALGCLDADLIAALVEGVVVGEQREMALAHLAACDHCRAAVASVARALADPRVAGEASAAEGAAPPRRTKWGRAAIAVAAAAAAILLLALPSDDLPPPAAHRAPAITAAAAPEAVSPVGAVAAAGSLRWSPVAGADRYRVTLFDADGGVRYEAELAATSVVLPDSARPTPGETRWWKVDARVAYDRWVSSELIEFTIDPGLRP